MPTRRPEYSRIVGYLATAATVGFAIYLLVQFSAGTHGYQFVESHRWISAVRRPLHRSASTASACSWWRSPRCSSRSGLLASADIERPKAFTVWMLLLEAALIAVFLSLDLVLFFVAFEFVLVPMYFLIAGWGYGNKVYAATKFFLYTMAGSAFLFVGLLSVAFLYHRAGHPLTFDVRTLTAWTSAKGNISTGVSRRAVPRVLRRVRGEGAAVPVPHLAARRAHRSADRGFGRARRRAPEDGHLRVPALRDPDVPAGRGRPRADPARRRRSSASSTGRSSPRCNPT